LIGEYSLNEKCFMKVREAWMHHLLGKFMKFFSSGHVCCASKTFAG